MPKLDRLYVTRLPTRSLVTPGTGGAGGVVPGVWPACGVVWPGSALVGVSGVVGEGGGTGTTGGVPPSGTALTPSGCTTDDVVGVGRTAPSVGCAFCATVGVTGTPGPSTVSFCLACCSSVCASCCARLVRWALAIAAFHGALFAVLLLRLVNNSPAVLASMVSTLSTNLRASSP